LDTSRPSPRTNWTRLVCACLVVARVHSCLSGARPELGAAHGAQGIRVARGACVVVGVTVALLGRLSLDVLCPTMAATVRGALAAGASAAMLAAWLALGRLRRAFLVGRDVFG
jgi:hypothetical protein